MAKNQIGKSWQHKTTRKSSIRPTTLDIAWAAGIYEGEGSCAYSGGTHQVTVVQKDPWLTSRLLELFGGKVSPRKAYGRLSKGDLTAWNIYGGRARGFLMTIYGFLSPRRRLQVKTCLER